MNLVSVVTVTVDGTPLPGEAAQDLLSVLVREEVQHPATFSLSLMNWGADPARPGMKWSDDELFAIGKTLEIKLGYMDQTETLMTGEITGSELVCAAGQEPRFVVRGYDRGHRLMRGRKTHSFTHMTDSDIVEQIAGRYGLIVETEPTREVYPYVLQNNLTDAEFLETRAQRIGYEVFVRDRRLIFRARKHTAAESLTLNYPADLQQISIYRSSMQQVGAVAMRSWDAASKRARVGQSSSDDESSTMSGKALGIAAASSAFGDATWNGGSHPTSSQADADQVAKARLQRMALDYIRAESELNGRTDLRAGITVHLDGLGKAHSGLYYITSATHRYSHNGYRTSFEARRNAN
ncbi:phage late control D family protein [Terriglobus albidus]|nr:contractile injection system protein, VgrG/Pvc8 family [Terriglobus albidus]